MDGSHVIITELRSDVPEESLDLGPPLQGTEYGYRLLSGKTHHLRLQCGHMECTGKERFADPDGIHLVDLERTAVVVDHTAFYGYRIIHTIDPVVVVLQDRGDDWYDLSDEEQEQARDDPSG